MVVLASLEVLLALSLFLYRKTRRVYPGFDRWMVGESLQAAGYILLGLRGFIPDLLSIYGGNLVFPLAVVVKLEGIRRFFGLKPMSKAWYATPALQLALLLLAGSVGNQTAWRGAVTSAFTAALALLVAAVLWRQLPAAKRVFHATIAGSMTYLGILLAVRAAALFTALSSTTYDWSRGSPAEDAVFLGVILGVVAVTLGFLMLNSERLEHDLALAEGTLQGMVAELQQALAEVRTLSGLLPICAHCKRIRDDAGGWTRIEEFVGARTDAQFSHGICPDCARQHYPDLVD